MKTKLIKIILHYRTIHRNEDLSKRHWRDLHSDLNNLFNSEAPFELIQKLHNVLDNLTLGHTELAYKDLRNILRELGSEAPPESEAISDNEILEQVAEILVKRDEKLISLILEVLEKLNDETVSEEKFCSYCNKRKRLKGNGVIEPLCEC